MPLVTGKDSSVITVGCTRVALGTPIGERVSVIRTGVIAV
jgi:hypothetical protein